MNRILDFLSRVSIVKLCIVFIVVTASVWWLNSPKSPMATTNTANASTVVEATKNNFSTESKVEENNKTNAVEIRLNAVLDLSKSAHPPTNGLARFQKRQEVGQ